MFIDQFEYASGHPNLTLAESLLPQIYIYIYIYISPCTSLVPDIECNSTPLSSNGIIIISWSFVHTGGLNLTQVTVSSSTDTFMVWDFQPLPSTPTLVDEEGRPTSLTVSKLPAGNTYVFTVRAFNMLGNSSVSCPPITHDIGT